MATYQVPDDAQLRHYWESFGRSNKLVIREKLVILSAVEMAQVGTLEFNAKNPCEALGAKSSMVNYYFGGREGLMAEAAIFVYQDWIQSVQKCLNTKPSDPVAQIKKIIASDLEFTRRWGHMAVFASYPNSSPKLREIYHERFESIAQEGLEYYLAVLATLISDARAGRKSCIDFSIGNLPQSRLAADASALLAATSLSWSISGLTIWSAGQHIASSNLETKFKTPLTTKVAIRNHINHIINSVV